MSYSKHFAQLVLDAVAGPYASATTGDFSIALLTGAPSNSGGVFDISAVEHTADDYARADLAVTAFNAATGHAPATVTNSSPVLFPFNGDNTSWDPITHIAVIYASNVLAVFRLTNPHTVSPSRRARIPVGGLVLKMSSI